MAYCKWQKTLVLAALIHSFSCLVRAGNPSPSLNLFVTRPELRAPKWNVTVYDQEQVSPGYWFTSPYERIGQTTPGDGFIGPHIYDNNGELIWSGAHIFGNMSIMDFRISHVRGRDVISLIRPELRTGILLDNSFRMIEDISIDGLNMHDFNFVDDGKRALLITRGVKNATEEMSKVTGLEHGECEANFLGIEEFDVDTWEPVWNWTSYGRIGFDESTFKYGPASARCAQAWDFMHANAVDKCPDGDIIMSARHTDTIYKISKKDGSIVWRLGGLKSDFEMGNVNFSRQHDVRCRSQNETHTVISFLDNAKGEDPKKPTSAYSRGLLVALEHNKMQASLAAHYDHPYGPGHYAYRRGSFQKMSNDHAFMCWSEHSHQSEHSPDGKLIMETRMLATWLGTYRSYKFPFVGRPIDPPDVFAKAFGDTDNSTNTLVYVSWNGATDVAAWNLYKTDAKGNQDVMSLIATKEKKGFETSIAYDGFAKYVILEALDKDGKAMPNGRSMVFATQSPANVLTPDVAREKLWLQQVAEGLVTTEAGSRLIITGHPGVAFAGGFLLCALLTLLGWALWWSWQRGLKIKLPWHQRQQEYQPLGEKEEMQIPVTDLEDQRS